MGVYVAIARWWARFRGERCLSTVMAASPPFGTGEELVVGNRSYRVTRVLRVGGFTHPGERRWEVWGQRQPGARAARVTGA